MILIDKTQVYGTEAAFRGMRNPLNSWEKSDSYTDEEGKFVIGENDKALAMRLIMAGTDHGKVARFIQVWVDVTGPMYWWKEFDTYRMGVEKNSCSTMHKLMEHPFTWDDFSHEVTSLSSLYALNDVITKLNELRTKFLDKSVPEYERKAAWKDCVMLLPMCYMQKRTLMISYAALRNIYHARRDHKLVEWHTFCQWIEELPVSELITSVRQDS